jgi:hypothetical protein
MFDKWFSKTQSQAQPLYPLITRTDCALLLNPQHQLPILDWLQCEPADSISDDDKDQHWREIAASWLHRLSSEFSDPLRLCESSHFFALSALTQRETEVLLDYAERTLKRNMATLDGIASDAGFGKYVVMVLPSEDDYYRYVSEYTPEGAGEQAFSGGMFIHDGYGHFVFCKGTMDAMEPTLVHELAHALVAHLPLPAWVNEGLAVNTERRWAPRPQQYKPHELAYLHSRFWNAETMQEFWSGQSYRRPDDGNALSYDLAHRLIALIGQDHDRLTRFVLNANYADGGQQAALEVLGQPIETLTSEAIGAEFTAPDPERWHGEAEKGWF